MDKMREQLEWLKGAIARGEVSQRDYRSAMRDQMAPLRDVLSNMPLMMQVMGAHPDVVERTQKMTIEILGEFHRLVSEEPSR